MVLLALAGIAFWIPLGLHPTVMCICHLLLLVSLLGLSRKINPEEQGAIRKYYLFIWVLFFAEYLSFALAAGWPI
ncbi:MAG: hypothetical protein AAGD05_14845 [Bacteroidota bacterium]